MLLIWCTQKQVRSISQIMFQIGNYVMHQSWTCFYWKEEELLANCLLFLPHTWVIAWEHQNYYYYQCDSKNRPGLGWHNVVLWHKKKNISPLICVQACCKKFKDLSTEGTVIYGTRPLSPAPFWVTHPFLPTVSSLCELEYGIQGLHEQLSFRCENWAADKNQ